MVREQAVNRIWYEYSIAQYADPSGLSPIPGHSKRGKYDGILILFYRVDLNYTFECFPM